MTICMWCPKARFKTDHPHTQPGQLSQPCRLLASPLTSLLLQRSLAGPQLLPEQLNLPPPVSCNLH